MDTNRGRLTIESSDTELQEAEMNTIELLQGDKWLKHPLHPALVSVPIGSWIFSLAMDGIASVTKNECAQEAADTAITAGLVGAVLSATTGVSEFLRVPDKGGAVDSAVTHGALNITTTGLYALNALIRTSRRNQRKPIGLLPKLMSLAGVAAIGYTGWLGGHLVYRYGTAVQLDQGAQGQGKEEPEQQQTPSQRRSEKPERAHV